MLDRYNEEEVLGFIEGDLTHEQKIEFEKKLVDDPRLRNLVAHLVLDRHRLRNMPDELAPPATMEPANLAIERHMLLGSTPGEPAQAPANRFHITRWAAVGGVAAMIALVATIFFQTLANPGILNLAGQKPTAPGQVAQAPISPDAATMALKQRSDSRAELDSRADKADMSSLPPLPDSTATLAARQAAAHDPLYANESTLDEAAQRGNAIAKAQQPAAAPPVDGAVAGTDTATQLTQQPSTEPFATAAHTENKALHAPTENTAVPSAELANKPVASTTAKQSVLEELLSSSTQISIASASPQVVAEHVRAWAMQNKLEMLTERPALAESKEKTEQLTSPITADADATPAEEPVRIMLVATRDQATQLVAELSKDTGNKVLLMEAVRRSMSADERQALAAPAAIATPAPSATQPADPELKDIDAALLDSLKKKATEHVHAEKTRGLDTEQIILSIVIRNAPANETSSPVTTQPATTDVTP